MQKSIGIVINPKTSNGVGSIAMLLNSLRRAESKALAWPTSKVMRGPSYSSMRKGSRIPDVPLASRSAISQFRLNREREQINKTEADKSKFYNILKYNESGENISKRNRSLSRISAVSIASRGRKRFPSVHDHLKPHMNLYMVPTRPSVNRSQANPSNLTDVINQMLKGISFHRATELRAKSSRQAAESSSQEAQFKSKERNATVRRGKVKKGEFKSVILPDLLTNEKKKKPKVKRRTKKRVKKPFSLDKSLLDLNQVKKSDSDPEEFNEFLKIMKKISASHDSASINSRPSRSKKLRSTDSSEDRRRRKKSQLITEFDIVNRDILKTLDDPEKIREFLRNIKRLATKECSLFRKQFIDHVKAPDLNDPFKVQQYLDNLDTTVRIARISIEKRRRNAYDPDEDSISMDLENIEKMLSKGHNIRRYRDLTEPKRESKKRSMIHFDGIDWSSSDSSIISTPLEQPQTDPNSQFKNFDEIKAEGENLSRRKTKYGEPLVVHPRINIDLSKFDSQFGENLRFVPPISYEEMSKLTPEEFSKYFYGLDRDDKSVEYVKSIKSLFKVDLPLTYNYRLDQVRRYLYGSNVSLTDMENIYIDDIDLNKFLNYPYPEKYTEEENFEPKILAREPIRKKDTTKKFKIEKAQQKQMVDQKVPEPKFSKNTFEKIGLKEMKFEPDNPPIKQSCCICNSIQRNKPLRDDPLIVRMKNEMKRHELKAYIKEKQVLHSGFDKIFNDNRFKFENRCVLVPCQKPRSVCNQIYPANVFYRNIT